MDEKGSGMVKVEPLVTMKELAEISIQYNCIPPVLPEFKGITGFSWKYLKEEVIV